MKLYLTRDKDKALLLSNRKPIKGKTKWDLPLSKCEEWEFINLPDSWHPEIKWEMLEPIDCELLF